MIKISASPKAFRSVQPLLLLLALIWIVHQAFFTDSGINPVKSKPPIVQTSPAKKPPHHPIDTLHEEAQQIFADLISKQAFDLDEAERQYIARRGRRPPPGFDKWFRYAQKHDAIVVEEFFDRIYDDLAPFWAIAASDLRRTAYAWWFRISIRNGIVTKRTDTERPWLNLWSEQIQHIAHLLPDLDIAINEMDEPRMVVPWETINMLMNTANQGRKVVPREEMISEYNETVIPMGVDAVVNFDFAGWGPYWDHYVPGCPPDSPARKGYVPEANFTDPPPLPHDISSYTYKGFVKNWTSTRDPCLHPELQGLHGTFVEPLSISTTKGFFPMFGGSKLPHNNEILLPAAMYWSDDPFYSGGKSHGDEWKEKKTRLQWRGSATGGRNRPENWTRFQRHRFVAMVNGTSVARAEWNNSPPPNFVLPAKEAYDMSFDADYPLSQWLDEISDVGFVHLICFPDDGTPLCNHTNDWYFVEQGKSMEEQYGAKYLPDIDGNSFSGRYRGFLGSTSLPIKATIYSEWHDTRLVPWLHFAPMDNTFIDIYAILEYFVGTKKRAGHDEVAERMATEGKAWAEKVLRKEDMVIYVFRLLLEYARLCDDNRDRLGWALH